MKKLDLSGTWQIIEQPLAATTDAAIEVLQSLSHMAGSVPGDVSDALVQAGRMPEPLVGVNFREFAWVQERSWWYRRTVQVPGQWADAAAVELSLDGLDIHADIWVNGEYVGHHASAFYAFERDVRSYLRCGEENTILVRLTTGRERAAGYADRAICQMVPTEGSRGYSDRGMGERIGLRKPAYTWGWDWGPHLATCGITGKAMLRAWNKTEIADVMAVTRLTGDDAVVRVTVEMEHRTVIDSARADVTVRMTDADGQVFRASVKQQSISSGTNYVDVDVPIHKARLWWPNGSGESHLYALEAEAMVDGVALDVWTMRCGVRTVTLDTSPGRFAVVVNGRSLFMKGGNWVPGDALYGRITDAKLRTLVDEAADANFNCLRIWGGGRFEADRFYDACDERGILLWHDFMSACAPLPADEAWFEREFMAEAAYQIRRLRSRPCMMLWCGNNEVSQLVGDRADPGWHLYHRLLPAMVRQMCPWIAYRPTSPYGGRGTVHDPREGDAHHWLVMRPDSKYWSNPWYWDGTDVPIFNSEYGYGGPCCLTSTKRYMGSDASDLFSEIGREHTNTFYDIPRVNFSIAEHYCDPQGLPLDQYILFGGLCQGLNLGYSLQSMRANEQTMGGLFWMYNDTWGENGWTIIDYYLRRKISYYHVKRALTPAQLVLRRGGQAFGGSGDEILLLAINDTPDRLAGCCTLGYMRYDGSHAQPRRITFDVAPLSKAIIGRCDVPTDEQLRHGTIAAIPQQQPLLTSAHWLHRPYRRAGYPPAMLTITDVCAGGEDLCVTVSSDSFAHAVHLVAGDDVRVSDQYFDLLPGEQRTLIVSGGAHQPPDPLTVACVQWDGDGRCGLARFNR